MSDHLGSGPPIPRRRGRPPKRITADEVSQAKKYLTNPTSVGIYKFHAQWLAKSGVSADIEEQLEKKSAVSGVKTSDREQEHRLRQRRSLLRDANTISFVFGLFGKLLIERSDTEADKQDGLHDYRDSYVLQLLELDTDALIAKYSEAIDYFEQHIYRPGMRLAVTRNLTSIKSGSFIALSGPADESNGKFQLAALSPEPLVHIAKFLSLIGKIEAPLSYALFSPEEELLEPYVEITRSVLDEIDMPAALRRHFEKMISDYDSENWTGCVSTAGLVAEELLTQVYETIARSPAPKNPMLGQLYQGIGEMTKQIRTPTSTVKPQSRKDVMATIRTRKPGKTPTSLVASTSSDILKYVDSHISALEQHVVRSGAGNTDFSVFPEIVQLSLEDVISYRNNASHKSTIPIGPLESLKSVYGSLSLLIWWNSQKITIDGTKTQQEVLDLFIQSSKTYGVS